MTTDASSRILRCSAASDCSKCLHSSKRRQQTTPDKTGYGITRWLLSISRCLGLSLPPQEFETVDPKY